MLDTENVVENAADDLFGMESFEETQNTTRDPLIDEALEEYIDILNNDSEDDVYYATESIRLLKDATNASVLINMKLADLDESMESYSEESDDAAVSLEGFKDTVKKVGEVIMKVIRKLGEAIANFIKRLAIFIKGPILKSQNTYHEKVKNDGPKIKASLAEVSGPVPLKGKTPSSMVLAVQTAIASSTLIFEDLDSNINKILSTQNKKDIARLAKENKNLNKLINKYQKQLLLGTNNQIIEGNMPNPSVVLKSFLFGTTEPSSAKIKVSEYIKPIGVDKLLESISPKSNGPFNDLYGSAKKAIKHNKRMLNITKFGLNVIGAVAEPTALSAFNMLIGELRKVHTYEVGLAINSLNLFLLTRAKYIAVIKTALKETKKEE